MNKIIGIGEYAISQNVKDVLKTFALASCVAVTAYSPVLKVAGMIHIALPDPLDREDGKRRPGYYATTGVPLLIKRMGTEFDCGIKDLQIKVYGGALSVRADDFFKIGPRNLLAVRDTLAGMNLKIMEAQVGGTLSRSIAMDVRTGSVSMTTLQINF